MRLSSKDCQRLGIYFFYDCDGVVDRYVTYFLDDLSRQLSELVIVCNCELNDEGRQAFARYTTQVIVRPNEGLDVYAYKAGLDAYGWDRLVQADEVVLCNHTIMGPIHSFGETFAKMANRDVDFWGLTCHYQIDSNPFSNPYGYIPTHIQSSFMVYRKSLLGEPKLRAFWDKPPQITSYEESIGLYESWFTKHFADIGYRWETSVDTDDLQAYTDYPLMFYAKELIEHRGCPVFKRRTFFQPYQLVMEKTIGNAAPDLYEYLSAHTDYDMDLLWDNLLRTCHQSDLLNNLQLNYLLPDQLSEGETAMRYAKAHKLCLVMHLYFEDLIEESFQHACSMPEGTDAYITTDTQEKKRLIEARFASFAWGLLDVRVIENRGRDISALLVGVKDVIAQYDVCCFVHDKKTPQVRPGSVGQGFALKCYGNTLYNRHFCNNMVALFDRNPRLGIASPPGPNHAEMYFILGNEWTLNYKNTLALAKRLCLTVPMDPDKAPVAPLGTMFWFRPRAFAPLYAMDWQYDAFPAEPNSIDGTLLHALERIYPFVAQQAGFYPAYAMSQHMAQCEYTNLRYYLADFNHALYKLGVAGSHYAVKEIIAQERVAGNLLGRFNRQIIRAKLKRLLPEPLFKCLIMFKRKILGPRTPYIG